MAVGRLSQRSIFYLALCSVVIATIVLLMIYPDYRTLAALDKNIQRLHTKIQTHKMLFPLFQKMLTEIDLKLPGGVTFPKGEKLTQKKAESIVSIFHELSDKAGVKVVTASPDVESTLNGSGFLLMNVVVKGDFFRLQKFLLGLEKLPYLEKIEQIKLQSVEGDSEAKLKIWLAKETKGTKG